MAPLFKPGDLLCVSTVLWVAIQPGDIIIIRLESSINSFRYIVHRVISSNYEFLITRGDNNLITDAQKVTKDNVIGLVTSYGRQGHEYIVRGGNPGIFYSCLIYARNYSWMLIKRLSWRVYGWVRRSRLITGIWRPSITHIRVLTDEGPLIKYCFGTRTVARWWPQQTRFIVVKPFDLVIPNPNETK